MIKYLVTYLLVSYQSVTCPMYDIKDKFGRIDSYGCRVNHIKQVKEKKEVTFFNLDSANNFIKECRKEDDIDQIKLTKIR